MKPHLLPLLAQPALHAGPYARKLLALAPLAYWPLWEPSGSAMSDIASGYHGTYYNVALGQPGIGDGRTAAGFNGASSYAEVAGTQRASLGAAMDVAEFTLMAWLKVGAAGVWSDGLQRRQVYFGFGSETNDHFYMRKQTTASTTRCGRAGTTTPHIAVDAVLSTTDWFHACLTSSLGGNAVKFFIHGAQQGSTYTGPQPILGALASVLFGAASGAYYWSGCIAHIALFARPLSPAQVLQAASVR